jgi:hypothetical protein
MNVLKTVLQRIEQNPGAAVVFDLDSTLFDNGPRTLRIMLEWAQQRQPHLAAEIASLPRHRIAYSLAQNAERIPSWDESMLKDLQDFWFAFVRRCLAAGAQVIYLTGRDVPGMWSGTCQSLRAWGFPVGVPGVSLVLKPDFETDDSLFKGEAIEQINAHTDGVIASFENEAKNLVVMKRSWPDAEHILLDTNWDPRNAASLRDEFVKITDFSSVL